MLRLFEFIDDPVKGTKAVDDFNLAVGAKFPPPTFGGSRITYKRAWDDTNKVIITSILYEAEL